MHHRSTSSPWTACLAAALLAGGLPQLAAQVPRFVRGDINRDGQVTLADASYAIDFLFFGAPAPGCFDAADIGDDGQIRTVGLGEAEPLLDWLFRAAPSLPLPAPFPAAGVDPTMDPLNCADPTTTPPGPPGRRFTMTWDSPASAARGARDVPFLLLATTGTPIEGFSIAYRVDRSAVGRTRADLEDTIFPAALRALFEGSALFRVRVVPSADPGFDLLLAGAIFAGDLPDPQTPAAGGGGAFGRIPFPATQGPLDDAPLLRVLLSIREDAPLGPRKLLLPAEPEDFIRNGEVLHGVKSEYVGLDEESPADSNLSLTAGPDVTVLGDAEEFLRGDGNHDVKIDLSDSIATFGYLFLGGPPPVCHDAADANDDGTLDISDGTFTLNFLFLGKTAPPSPGPAVCGLDPTADALPLCLDEDGCP
jgi:hypothetical protein